MTEEQTLETYTTEETERMTREHPVDKVLGAYRPFWTDENLTGYQAVGFFRNSPAQNSEVERVFGVIVSYSAIKGVWVGYNTGWDQKALDEFQEGRKTGMLNHFGRGLDAAIAKELIDIAVIDGKICLVPKPKLVELTEARVKEYTNQTEQVVGA